MSGAWKPGDVALRIHDATDTYERSLVVEANRAGIYCPDTHAKAPHWHHQSGGWNPLIDSGDRADYVPLVVIDPNDFGDIKALVQETLIAANDYFGQGLNWLAEPLQKALQSRVAPGKPEEPTGLGAVVRDNKGERWCRFADAYDNDAHWSNAGAMVGNRRYADITAVEILSEGVTA